jgi:hypothetical protein
MIPIMGWMKTSKKYFDTVLNQIDNKSKSIVLKETVSTQQKQVKIVVNEILNTLNNNEKIIYYLDIYNIYKQYRNEFRKTKKDLKYLDNNIDRIIENKSKKKISKNILNNTIAHRLLTTTNISHS